MGKADTPYGDGGQAIQGKVDKPYGKVDTLYGKETRHTGEGRHTIWGRKHVIWGRQTHHSWKVTCHMPYRHAIQGEG